MRITAHTLLLLIALVAATPAVAAEAPKRPYTGKVYLGIGTEEVKLPADPRYKSTFGLLVTRVSAASTAEAAGLRIGDVVVSIDGHVWAAKNIQLSQSFGKVGEKNRPGEHAIFEILRPDPKNPKGPKLLVKIDTVLAPYPGTKPERGGTPSNDALRPDLKDYHPVDETFCWKLIDAFGYTANCRDLLERLRLCEEYPDVHRLAVCRYVHRDPFKLEKIADEIAGPIAARSGRGVADCAFFLDHVAQQLLWFDRRIKRPTPAPPALPPYTGKDLNAHLVYVEAVLKAAAERHKAAFAALSKADIDYIVQHRAGLLDAFITYKMLSYDENYARQKGYVKLLDLAARVDLRELMAQAKLVSLLVSPDFTASLLKAAEASKRNLDGGVIAARNTPFGQILVAGRGRNRYAGGQNCAAIYDLGGDDIYHNAAGASVVGKVPSAVVVDYAGNDAYESYAPFTQGCGDFGVGILVDLAGDDSYVGTRFTQGTGFMGIGMLIDEAGDDVYRGLEFHQGVGHWGVGILVDRQGRDRYEAHTVSQGVGLPGGCGLLYDGGSAGDSYYCKGNKGSGYGTAGVFEGWGQGMGIGYRPYASGGLGILFDEAGADRIEAGNFSQGGGYYYAFGILYNGGADPDLYIGSRYAQGFGCHQAAGVLIDQGGNDHYTTRYAVAQGLSWDESVALFIDQAGDDVYDGGGFSQGASAMNGSIIFLDRAGRDTYRYTDQARGGGNSYHGGTSLSFFVDQGGQDDAYPRRKNNTIENGGEDSLFADLPGSIADALKGDAWRALIVKPKPKPAPKKK